MNVTRTHFLLGLASLMAGVFCLGSAAPAGARRCR
jgi:hypothetical protein